MGVSHSLSHLPPSTRCISLSLSPSHEACRLCRRQASLCLSQACVSLTLSLTLSLSLALSLSLSHSLTFSLRCVALCRSREGGGGDVILCVCVCVCVWGVVAACRLCYTLRRLPRACVVSRSGRCQLARALRLRTVRSGRPL